MEHLYNIGLHLKRIMSDKQMTIAELAEKANLSEDSIKSIRSGKTKNPGIQVIASIADALSCPIDDLLNRHLDKDFTSFNNTYMLGLSRPLHLMTIMNEHTRNFTKGMLDLLLSIQELPVQNNIKAINILTPHVCYENGACFNNFTLDTIKLPDNYDKEVDFAIKLVCDSLYPNYKKDDVLMVKRKVPENNDTIFCTKNGNSYIRRFEYTKTSALLHSLNNTNFPIYDMKDDKFYFLGVITGLLKL